MKKINLTIISWGFPQKMGGAEKELVDIAFNINREKFCVNLYGWYPQNNLLLKNMVNPYFPEISFIDGLKDIRNLNTIRKLADSDIILQFGKNENGVSFIPKNYNSLFIDMLSSERNKIDPNYDILYCVCQYLKEFYMNNNSFYNEDDIFEWHYGYDNRDVVKLDSNKRNICRNNFCGEDNDIILGYVGRLEHFKRVDILIDVITRFSEEKIKLLIVGDGSEKEKLQEITKIRDIEKNVIFTGWLDGMVLNDVLQSMDIFLFASDSEGLPKAVNEAMRNSLPLISTMPGGMSQMCINSTGVRIIPEGTLLQIIDDFEWNIRDLILHRDQIKYMGNVNREYINKFNSKYTMDLFENKLIDYWRKKILL